MSSQREAHLGRGMSTKLAAAGGMVEQVDTSGSQRYPDETPLGGQELNETLVLAAHTVPRAPRRRGGWGTSLEDLTRGYKLCVADERDPGCYSGADAQSVQEAPRAAETNKNERQPAQSRS
ncbi:hypothetical protein H0G86_001326 [Trichoderma simmonsii]|uniref:Uncharacterized protein n=1 Tax=Trichoderma simmonsii TaxID=1491479 RepID=A0A8G0L612_9HYPO|nr:hypothetical protein H0G86_001326 [Trichoderma simmonsii]